MNEFGSVAHSFCDIFDGAENIFSEINHSIHRVKHTAVLATIFKRSVRAAYKVSLAARANASSQVDS